MCPRRHGVGASKPGHSSTSSRAKGKLIVVVSRSVFSLFSPDEETFADSLLWKNLLVRACPTRMWEWERGGSRVSVWGGQAQSERESLS
jgi:hypothetical protein